MGSLISLGKKVEVDNDRVMDDTPMSTREHLAGSWTNMAPGARTTNSESCRSPAGRATSVVQQPQSIHLRSSSESWTPAINIPSASQRRLKGSQVGQPPPLMFRV